MYMYMYVYVYMYVYIYIYLATCRQGNRKTAPMRLKKKKSMYMLFLCFSDSTRKAKL